jgi:hypothetical protein
MNEMSEPTIDEMIALMKQFAVAGKPVLGYGIEREQMSEPTIRELTGGNLPPDSRIWGYTLAELKIIIEEHSIQTGAIERIMRIQHEINTRTELATVRAFVERVDVRVQQEIYTGYEDGYQVAVEDELAAMEKPE